MGNIWFTSDLHFNHKNILQYEVESRGSFSSLEDMNEVLINNWNGVVEDEDIVYVLGDVFMGCLDAIDAIMPRLKGRKILIRGNHDTNPRVARLEKYFEEVHDIYNLKYGNRFYVLCHYPMREWQHKEHGAIHLYGHIHSNEHRNGILSEKNSFHVGVDTNNLTPISIEQINWRLFSCVHPHIKTEGNSEVYCVDCGKIVKKYIVNDKETWI